MKHRLASRVVWLPTLLLLTVEPVMGESEEHRSATGKMELLWQIGEADGQAGEFALGPDGYFDFLKRFPIDPLFVVGRSDAREDWPYFHPGPLDAWVGSRPHTYTIIFGLAQAPPDGEYRPAADLVDTHCRVPSKLIVSINGHSFEHQTPIGGSDFSLEGQPQTGPKHRFVITIPTPMLHQGDNSIAIKSVSGCWLVYDCLTFEGPHGAKTAPVTPRTYITGGRDSAEVAWLTGGRISS